MPRLRWPILVIATVVLACSSPTGSADPGGSAAGRTIPPGPYVAGQSYLGRNGYIEYFAGNSPVVITAPHGGYLLPGSIPDRVPTSCGGAATTVTDLSTIELARAMQQRWFARFGKYPHVVISNLSRRKLDPNRTIEEAACGSEEAKVAWMEWHEFIDVAKSAALTASGKVWYMDMHGHGHAAQRLELGYLLAGSQLDLSDAALNANVALEDSSSIRTASKTSPLTFAELLRGPSSLGALYEVNGFSAIPSASDPSPRGDPYFSGGDNTRRHSCGAEASVLGGSTGGNVCGVQIETNFTGVRDSPTNRNRFGDATAIALEQYLSQHWGLRP